MREIQRSDRSGSEGKLRIEGSGKLDKNENVREGRMSPIRKVQGQLFGVLRRLEQFDRNECFGRIRSDLVIVKIESASCCQKESAIGCRCERGGV